MNIDSILAPERTRCSLPASSKKKAIESVSEIISATLPDLELGTVYRHLIEREKLGTTAIGNGIAIPHCRLPECPSIVGGLFQFNEPLDFSAHDEIPVKVLFVLLVPQSETSNHLKTLATLAEGFSDESVRTQISAASSDAELYHAALKLTAVNAATVK